MTKVGSIALILSAAAGAALAGQRQQVWKLSPKPLVQIGVIEGDPNYELFDARSSIRLQNGRMVVLNGGASELRMFDAKGKFLKKIGRKGNGPGEFRSPQRVYYTHRDSILVYDAYGEKEVHLDGQGGYVGGVDGAPVKSDYFRRDQWVYGRFLVDGPPIAADRPVFKPALDRLPAPPPGEYRLIRVDPWRRLWVREARRTTDATQNWSIYNGEGRPLATLATPSGFELHQIGPDFVLGRNRTDLESEVIELWGLQGTGQRPNLAYFTPAAARVYTRAEPVEVAPAILNAMRSILRHAMSQQEVHYSRAMTYTTDPSRLKLPEDGDITPHILEAGERGWSMVVVHRELEAMCVVAQGAAPVGWTAGRVLCGEARARK